MILVIKLINELSSLITSDLRFGRLEVISRRLIDGHQSFYVIYCFHLQGPNHCLKLLALRGH
jgi:hypothetical protein